MNRIVSAARLHLVAPALSLLLPWLIMGSSFLINVLIWGLADIPEGRDAGTAGLASLYLTLFIVYIQSMSALLPFAMGLSLTRRSFYLGTALFAGLQCLVYGVLFYGLLLVERATAGWGVGLPFFGGFQDHPWLRWAGRTARLASGLARGCLRVLHRPIDNPLFAGWPLLLGELLAAAGYLGVRRVVP